MDRPSDPEIVNLPSYHDVLVLDLQTHMHYVVRSPELRSHIFADCGNRFLVALAQTCHDFFATAAPIMWRSLSSLGPLFGCLPQSVAKMTDPTHMVSSTRLDIENKALMSSRRSFTGIPNHITF